MWDKINASVKDDEEVLKAMYRLAAVSVLTSQGPAFFLAGEEMLRGKPTEKDNSYDNRPNVYLTDSSHYFSDNSYQSPDSVNAIDWTQRIENDDMIEFYKQLIAFKKAVPAFQLETLDEIKDSIVIIDEETDDGVAVYGINVSGYRLIIALNATAVSAEIGLPEISDASAEYVVVLDGADISGEGLDMATEKITVGAYSAAILFTEEEVDFENWTYDVTFPKA